MVDFNNNNNDNDTNLSDIKASNDRSNDGW